jgi:hypothetical protein
MDFFDLKITRVGSSRKFLFDKTLLYVFSSFYISSLMVTKNVPFF